MPFTETPIVLEFQCVHEHFCETNQGIIVYIENVAAIGVRRWTRRSVLNCTTTPTTHLFASAHHRRRRAKGARCRLSWIYRAHLQAVWINGWHHLGANSVAAGLFSHNHGRANIGWVALRNVQSDTVSKQSSMSNWKLAKTRAIRSIGVCGCNSPTWPATVSVGLKIVGEAGVNHLLLSAFYDCSIFCYFDINFPCVDFTRSIQQLRLLINKDVLDFGSCNN